MRIVLAAKPGADLPFVYDAVADLAKQTGASVAVVAVDQVELERFASVPRAVFAERAEQAVQAAVRHLTAAGVEATAVVLPGRPVERILAYADEVQADLIVAGSSSRPKVAERLLGSVPLALIKESSRPVVVVTHPHAR